MVWNCDREGDCEQAGAFPQKLQSAVRIYPAVHKKIRWWVDLQTIIKTRLESASKRTTEVERTPTRTLHGRGHEGEERKEG